MNLDLKSNLLRELKEGVKAALPDASRRALSNLVHRKTRVITSLSELDDQLAVAEKAFARSDDEGRAVLEGFSFASIAECPDDPFSDEYREVQLELYRKISGRSSYSVDNERSVFDLELAKRSPFPFQTQSPTTVGDQLIAMGFLIKAMNLSPASRLVEFGPGWGNTTLSLLQMGYEVTAVEVDPAFIELIAHRCRDLSAQLTLVQQDMLRFDAARPFDAAIFFESFHHCADPLRLLQRLDAMVVDSGLLMFASEPIGSFPIPWGVRLDGQSVWAMRRHGWLELGFHRSFFDAALRKHGWEPQRLHSSSICPLTDVVIARKRQA